MADEFTTPPFASLILTDGGEGGDELSPAVEFNNLVLGFSADLRSRLFRGWIGILQMYLDEAEEELDGSKTVH